MSTEVSFELISILIQVELSVFDVCPAAVVVGGEMIEVANVIVVVNIFQGQNSRSEPRRVCCGVFRTHTPVDFLTFGHVTATNINGSVLVIYPSTNDGSYITTKKKKKIEL